MAPVPGEDVLQLALQARARKHAVDEIGPIERSHQLDRIVERELRRDIPTYARGGGRRVRVQADSGEHTAKPGELTILGSEIVAPLADAVCLVHGDETDAGAREQGDEAVAPLSRETLR